MKRPITAYHAELTRAFLARRCSVCGDAASVIAVWPGDPDRNYCLRCLARLCTGATVEDADAETLIKVGEQAQARAAEKVARSIIPSSRS